MPFSVRFTARGHRNVKSTHRTTFMTTTEEELSKSGDCIIVVGAGMGLKDMPDEAKRLARSEDTVITFRLTVDGHVFEARGRGHPDLEYTDPIDMVARRSGFTCGRTLMVNCDKTSRDLPGELIDALRNPSTVAEITLVYDNQTGR